jgi:hypothetical protein
MNGGLGARFVHIQSCLCQGVLLWLRFGWIWRHEREDGILTPWVFSLSRYLSILGQLGGHAGSYWREVIGLRRLWAGFLRWGLVRKKVSSFNSLGALGTINTAVVLLFLPAPHHQRFPFPLLLLPRLISLII